MKLETSCLRFATARYALLAVVLFWLLLPATSAGQHATPPKPVIYSTDLTYTL